MSNIIQAAFGTSKYVLTAEQPQYAYGQFLSISGADLPETFEIYYSNASFGGKAKRQIGENNIVPIPDEYFVSGHTIYAWIVMHEGTDDGKAEYRIEIPIKRGSKPTDEQPTPIEQSVITQAIAVLNNAVELTSQYEQTARQALAEIESMSFHIDANGCLIMTKPNWEEEET